LNKKIADELGLSESLTKHVFNYIITYVRDQFIKASTKDIMIHYFGTFILARNRINKFEEKLHQAYKKKSITKSKYEKGLKNLETIKEKCK
jgi:nucleoid DNA-binding protein